MVTTATSVQTAIPTLKREEKTLYYLVVGEEPEQVIINVGEKTYIGVKKLIEAAPKSSDDIKSQLKLAGMNPDELLGINKK